MAEDNQFKIISVAGAHTKAGKTTLCSILLKNLSGYGAIKFTKSPIYTSVTDDPETIEQKNTDTAKLSAAGAEKVVWVQSDKEELEEAMDIALGRMHGLKGVIIEGNSPVDFSDPHLLIFIIGKEGQIKPSALGLSKRADIIVINSENPEEPHSLPASMMNKNAKIFRLDLENEAGEIDDFIECVIKDIGR